MSSGSSSLPSSTSSKPDPNEKQAPPRIPRLGWVIAFLCVTTLIAWAYMQFSAEIQSRKVASRLERLAQAPQFTFTAQDGSTVSTADFKGKIWVANFIFTRCAGPCPLMTSRMAEVNQALGKKATDVELVTITVDPEYDTPEVLKEYGDQVGASPDRWKFLTGPKDQIETVVMKGFLQALSREPSGVPIHSTRFVLVDRDGWIRGFLDGNDPELPQKLLMDIGDLLRESPSVGRN
ncbi:MAG TPA: SCO family protein [Terrimicrobiaceae bacterium]|jgi:protein SCO1/2